jgi:hypothetical protein
MVKVLCEGGVVDHSLVAWIWDTILSSLRFVKPTTALFRFALLTALEHYKDRINMAVCPYEMQPALAG